MLGLGRERKGPAAVSAQIGCRQRPPEPHPAQLPRTHAPQPAAPPSLVNKVTKTPHVKSPRPPPASSWPPPHCLRHNLPNHLPFLHQLLVIHPRPISFFGRGRNRYSPTDDPLLPSCTASYELASSQLQSTISNHLRSRNYYHRCRKDYSDRFLITL